MWISGKDYGGDSASIPGSQFDNRLHATRNNCPTDVQQVMSNFLSSHDISRFDATNRIAAALNNDPVTHTITVPVWQLSVANGSQLTELVYGTVYTVQNGQVSVTVNGHYGAILAQ